MFTMESRSTTTGFRAYLNGYKHEFDLYRTTSPTFTEEFRRETSMGSVPDGSTIITLATTMEELLAVVTQHKEDGFTLTRNAFDRYAKYITIWVEKDTQEVVNNVHFSTHTNNIPHFVGGGTQSRLKFCIGWDSLSAADFKLLTQVLEVTA